MEIKNTVNKKVNLSIIPTAAITGLTLAFLANNYSGEEHFELCHRVTNLLAEIERLRNENLRCCFFK